MKSQSLDVLLQSLQDWEHYTWEYKFLQSEYCSRG